jgi:DNA-binding IscR family transcriptional regulator
MRVALRIILFLERDDAHSASVGRLARAIGSSVGETRRVVARLAGRGIVRDGAAAGDAVSLLVRPSDLTLADVASATTEWLTIAPCGRASDNGIPGLPQALSLVRERATEGLKEIRLTPFTRTLA